MHDLEQSRTLVKSAPELWTECSEAATLARHLGAFGEIRVTRLEPETTVAWEGDAARGTVRLEPSGWGTRVTLTAQTEPPAPDDDVLTGALDSLGGDAPPAVLAVADRRLQSAGPLRFSGESLRSKWCCRPCGTTTAHNCDSCPLAGRMCSKRCPLRTSSNTGLRPRTPPRRPRPPLSLTQSRRFPDMERPRPTTHCHRLPHAATPAPPTALPPQPPTP